MLPMRTRIFLALQFLLPRPRLWGKILSFRGLDTRTRALYEMQKAEKLRAHLIKTFARR
ncbi:hypothetical protein MNBD_NITROSPINAE05-941 [hydrothermal vent metagenome]|uniref:Uncharacterized protein n=1 Tax=hydrothermal vent metagenome TaxID=652676 RepID=A0A3B1CZ32_9ZZZZ